MKKHINNYTSFFQRFFCLLILVAFISLPLHSAIEKPKENKIKLYKADYENLLLLVHKSVKLPLSEYNKLLKKVFDKEEEEKKTREKMKNLRGLKSYQKYNLTGGKLDFTVSGDTAVVKAEIGINYLKEGWKETTLSSLPGLEYLKIDGLTIPLKSSGGDTYKFFTDKTGKKTISLLYHPRITRRKERAAFFQRTRIELNQRTPINVSIKLPRGAKPSSSTARKMKFSQNDGIWQARLKSDFSRPIDIEWFVPRKEVSEAPEGTLISDVKSFYQFRGKTIFYSALVHLQIMGNHIPEVTLNLPDNFTLIDRELPESIKMKNKTGKNSITLLINDEATENLQFILIGEIKLPENEYTVIPVKVSGVRRETGFVAIGSDGYQVNVEEKGIYQPIDARLTPVELEMLAGSTAKLGFQYSRNKDDISPLKLSVNEEVRAKTLSASIEDLTCFMSLSKDGILMIEENLKLVGSNIQFLSVKLSRSTNIISAKINGRGVKPVKDSADRILIPLKDSLNRAGKSGQIKLIFSAKLESFLDEGTQSIIFPKFELPVQKAKLELFLPQGYEYEDFTGNFKPGELTMAQTDFDIEGDYFGRDESEMEELQTVTTGERAPGRKTAFKQALVYNEKEIRGARSIEIKIPKVGQLFKFWNILIVDEELSLTFNYEEE